MKLGLSARGSAHLAKVPMKPGLHLPTTCRENSVPSVTPINIESALFGPRGTGLQIRRPALEAVMSKNDRLLDAIAAEQEASRKACPPHYRTFRLQLLRMHRRLKAIEAREALEAARNRTRA